MGNDGDRYCLLLAREQELDVSAVARSAAEFFDAPLPEIALTIRKGGGFLASAVPKVIAVEMQRRLDAVGVETLLLPHSILEPLPHPHTVRTVELGPRAFVTYASRGAPGKKIPYSRIMFLSVCVLMRSNRRRESRVEGPKSIRDTLHRFNPLKTFHESIERRALKPRRKAEALLDVYTKDPCDCYRMSRSNLDYRGLGEEKSDTARKNFPALLRVLIEKAPRAYVTNRTRRFLEGARAEKIAFSDMTEIRRYHTWLLNVLGSR